MISFPSFPSGAMECNLSDTDIDRQCLGKLGAPLNFNLPIDANKQITLTTNDLQILKIVNNIGTISSGYQDRASFFTNGTLKLKTASKSDSGDYTLETHGRTDGVFLHKTTIHLKIQGKTPKIISILLNCQYL